MPLVQLGSASEIAIDFGSYTESKRIRWTLPQADGWQVQRIAATI